VRRTRVFRVVLLLVPLAAVSSQAATPLSRADRSLPRSADRYAVTEGSIGGFSVDHATYSRAVRYFAARGVRLTAAFSRGMCTLTSQEGGFQLSFVSFAGRGTPMTCRFFFAATMAGSAWHTENGLRVHDPLTRLRELFPKASDRGLTKPQFWVRDWSAWWWLTPTTGGPTLTAFVTRGQVVALGLDFLGH
jgi:hypothetical protein